MTQDFVNANTIFIGLPLNVTFWGIRPSYFTTYQQHDLHLDIKCILIYLSIVNRVKARINLTGRNCYQLRCRFSRLALISEFIPDFATNTFNLALKHRHPLSLIYIGIVLQRQV